MYAYVIFYQITLYLSIIEKGYLPRIASLLKGELDMEVRLVKITNLLTNQKEAVRVNELQGTINNLEGSFIKHD